MRRTTVASSAARFIAGTLAALWGMLGLTVAYTFASLYGVRAAIVVAIILNVALVSSAAMAIVNLPRWRGVMLLALILVALDRLFNMIFMGFSWIALIEDAAALLAIGAMIVASPSSRPAAP